MDNIVIGQVEALSNEIPATILDDPEKYERLYNATTEIIDKLKRHHGQPIIDINPNGGVLIHGLDESGILIPGPNERLVWEHCLSLDNGAMKRVANIVLISKRLNKAWSIGAGYSASLPLWIGTNIARRTAADASIRGRIKWDANKRRCFARIISFSERLGLTGPDNFDITVDTKVLQTTLHVESQQVIWRDEPPWDKVNERPAEVILENCNGNFVIPVFKDEGNCQRCSLVRRDVVIDTTSLNLGDELEIDIYAFALEPTNRRYSLRALRREPPRGRGDVNGGDRGPGEDDPGNGGPSDEQRGNGDEDGEGDGNPGDERSGKSRGGGGTASGGQDSSLKRKRPSTSVGTSQVAGGGRKRGLRSLEGILATYTVTKAEKKLSRAMAKLSSDQKVRQGERVLALAMKQPATPIMPTEGTERPEQES